MFWIHGGGNTSGVKDYYDFSELIREHQVIVVTINYRLGPMGWFTHPAIQGLQNGIDKASNFGTLDIMEALKWVQTNIQNFGGDPENITIFGESAGGNNVLSLLASPMGNGSLSQGNLSIRLYNKFYKGRGNWLKPKRQSSKSIRFRSSAFQLRLIWIWKNKKSL
jgi:hypothetical protein